MSLWRRNGPPTGAFRLNRASMQAQGLVAWWPPLGSVGASVLRDYTGHGAHASLQMATGTSWSPFPDAGVAIYVDRDVSLAAGALVTTFPAANYAAFSYTTWLYRVYAGDAILLQESSSDSLWIKVDRAGADDINVYLGDTTTPGYHNFGTGSVPVNTWLHIGVTYDGAAIRGYVNGQLVGSPSATTGTVNLDATVSMWRREGVSADTIVGYGGDTRIYNRALSAAEVWQMWDPATKWELHEPEVRYWPVKAPVAAAGNPLLMHMQQMAYSRGAR